MNHQTWTTKRLWAVMIGVFVLGLIIASGRQSAAIQASAPQVRTVTREVKVTDTAALGRLNDLDKQIFAASAEVIGLQSEGLNLAGNALGSLGYLSVSDVNAMTASMQAKTARIGDLTAQLKDLLNQRQALLGSMELE